MGGEAADIADREARTHRVLRRIDALPTLSSVAVRTLRASGDSDAGVSEIVRLIEADPALSARVLKLCQSSDTGLAGRVSNVEQAAVLLGLESVCAAVLSVEVIGLMSNRLDASEASGDGGAGLDHSALWRHSLAVAIASQRIAESHRALVKEFKPSDVFVAGLLHDLGKLALERALPKAYARVCALAMKSLSPLAEVERRVLGVDHHVAGKRLAERWGLPRQVQASMWLHGTAMESLPDVGARSVVGIVQAANLLVRSLHLGLTIGRPGVGPLERVCEAIGLDVARVRALEEPLIEELSARSAALGLEEAAPARLLLDALAGAQRAMEATRAKDTAQARRQAEAVDVVRTIGAFQESVEPGAVFEVVSDAVANSAMGVRHLGVVGAAFSRDGGRTWLVSVRGGETDEVRAPDACDPSSGVVGLLRASIVSRDDSVQHANADVLLEAPGCAAVLLVEASASPAGESLGVLRRCWRDALANAVAIERSGNELETFAGVASRIASETDRAVDNAARTSLLEVTAGAAHEMNNPLTVLSGQAQLLYEDAADEIAKQRAGKMVASAQHLSELVTGLHELSHPPEIRRRAVPLRTVLEDAVVEARNAAQRLGLWGGAVTLADVEIELEDDPGLVWLDAPGIAQSVTDLLINAMESEPRSYVSVRGHLDPLDGRLVISVLDDGRGMSVWALSQACTPFFSDRRAGRGRGLGLTRVKRMVERHGGELVLESEEGRGTAARLVLAEWEPPANAAFGDQGLLDEERPAA